MNSRQRFLAALNCQTLDRPPVWVMRQAGRYLPEYRALKELHSFTEMVKTPDLATEVTLQPLKRFELDAAILFSDILVIPEALGQPYHFKDGGGIAMDYILDSEEKINQLDPTGTAEKLAYMGDALRQIRSEIKDEKMLLGFGGSPWTLAAYMTEGGSLKNCSKLKNLFYQQRKLFDALMEKITTALIDLFKLQIEAGADALQIFDSAGAFCCSHHYDAMSLQWIERTIEALPEDFPIIIYAKGMAHQYPHLLKTGARALSVDWTVDIAEMHDLLPADVALQGNLDPSLLDGCPETLKRETLHILDAMRGKAGHIFNLGHGILPSAKPENMAILVETIRNYGN